MPEGPSIVVGGKRCQFHYFTGKVMSSQKQKETVVSSQTYGTQNNPQVSVSSTTVDHHEFFLMDDSGKEQSFKTVNLDFPCREGNIASVIWVIPEGAREGPYVEVCNHNTGERNVIDPKRIAFLFRQSRWLKWGIGVGAWIVLSFLEWYILGFAALLAPFVYDYITSRKNARALLSSDAMRTLDEQLSRVRPPLAKAS